MKTIKDAVIERGGKWFSCADCEGGDFEVTWFNAISGVVTHVVICGALHIEKEQFESEAKRMGYINGYLWGKEYPTNGKRPDLDSDVRVTAKFNGKWQSYGDEYDNVEAWNWQTAQSFRITDPRYKPVGEASERKHDEVSEAIYAFYKLPNSLQDLYQESFDKWVKKRTAEIKAKTEREKVIEAALDAAIENYGLYGPLAPHINQILERIYDAGMLVLPPKKSDTED